MDFPPGLFGFGAEMLQLASAIQRREMPEGYPDWTSGEVIWDARTYVVTTPDKNDLLPVYENVALSARTFGAAPRSGEQEHCSPGAAQRSRRPYAGTPDRRAAYSSGPAVDADVGEDFVDGVLRWTTTFDSLPRSLRLRWLYEPGGICFKRQRAAASHQAIVAEAFDGGWRPPASFLSSSSSAAVPASLLVQTPAPARALIAETCERFPISLAEVRGLPSKRWPMLVTSRWSTCSIW